MTQTSFDDEELFTEAAEDMQTEIEESVSAATATLPSKDALREPDPETLLDALDAVKSEIDIEAVEAALTDVKKTFVLGQRAEAFDSAYVTETEATITDLEETVATLREIETATAELHDALSIYEPETHPEPESGSGSSPEEATEESDDQSDTEELDGESSTSDGPTESRSDTDIEDDASEKQEQQEVTDTTERTD